MTLNDQTITECTRIIHRHEELLDRHVRDDMEASLFLDFMLIRDAANKAMERLNEIKPKEQLPDGYQ
jgi:hypothetical protein